MVAIMIARMAVGIVIVAAKPLLHPRDWVVDQHIIRTVPPLVLMALLLFDEGKGVMARILTGITMVSLASKHCDA